MPRTLLDPDHQAPLAFLRNYLNTIRETFVAMHAAEPTVPNPVLPGFHPDPSVCRVGEDYYLVCSSFEYFPGIPIFHSRDLVHWTQIGNVLDRHSQLDLPASTVSSQGIYAPTLRHHDGLFHLIVTNVSGGGNLLVTAADPAGPWSEPLPLPGVPGIDPDLAWDEEGTCWCTVAGVGQVRLDLKTGKAIGEVRRIWSGTPGAKAPEAPHLYHVGKWWYLLIAEGGTERGHGVSVARGPSPSGPFTPHPANPILSHRSTGHPVQNTGHADLVEAPDGSWWAVLLGVRPGGGTPGWHVLGRETYLAPVTWVDQWPVIGEPAPALPAPPWPLRPAAVEPIREDFDAPDPHPRWISLRHRPSERYTTAQRPGWLTLRAAGGGDGNDNGGGTQVDEADVADEADGLDSMDATFLGRRQQHLACRVRALIDPAEGRGGLTVRLDEHHYYAIEASADAVRVIARIGPLRTVIAERPAPQGPVTLRIETRPTDAGYDPRASPDTVVLGIEEPEHRGASDNGEAGGVDGGGGGNGDDGNGMFDELAALDGRYLSSEVAGGFTGRVIGVYAAEGAVHTDWFDYISED